MKFDHGILDLYFKDGIYEYISEERTVSMIIRFYDADINYSTVYILSKSGHHGKFKGRKLKLKKFINKYKKYSFEIISETYHGYETVYMGGLHKNEEYIECIIYIYHTGVIEYIVCH